MSSLKQLTLEFALRAGLFRLAQCAARRREAVILTFHRFWGNGEGLRGGMPIQSFADNMEYLTRHYRVVSLHNLTEGLRRGVVAPYTVAVTVDDGYHEVFSLVAPVLKRCGIPASFFVISDFIEGRSWPWTDRLRFVFYHAPRERVPFRHRRSVHVLEMRDEDDRQRAEARWLEHAKKLPVVERDELIETVAEAAAVEIPSTPPREYHPLTWTQLRALAADGFDVGAHTRTHPILSRVGPEQLRDEIEGCKGEMEQKLGFHVRHFAYPNGGRDDYTPEAVAMASRAGYSAAVTTLGGGNTPSTSLLELHRICPAEGLPNFAQSVSGFEQIRGRMRALGRLDRRA